MATIRSMTPADYKAAAALADHAVRHALAGRPLWETEDDVAAEVGAPGHRSFVVAEDENGAVVGVAGYRLLPDGEAELYGPVVSTEGYGVGAWLESRVVNMATQDGASSVSMLVGLDNREGAAWAEWRGYLRDSESPELLITFLYPGELKKAHLAAGAQVRRAVPADLERLDEVFGECFPREHSGPANWLDECWVVEENGRVAGFLRLEPATSWVTYLCVDPALRQRGLGARLLVDVVERWWAEAPRKVGLAVPLDDTTPVTLFRRLGFRREVPVAKWMKR